MTETTKQIKWVTKDGYSIAWFAEGYDPNQDSNSGWIKCIKVDDNKHLTFDDYCE